MIRVWQYWIIRPKAPLLAAHFTLVMAVFLHLAWNSHAISPWRAFNGNLGLILLFLLPQLCFYFHGLEALILGASLRQFLFRTLSALGIGLILAAPLFWIFPNLFPGLKGAVAVVGLSTLLLLCLRPLLRWFVRHKKFAEGLMILGSGEMAGKFYRELVNGNGNHTSTNKDVDGHRQLSSLAVEPGQESLDSGIVVNYDQLPEMALRNRISRIVVAEPNVRNSEELAVALLDCKLRGLEVEQAVESYEKFNGKLWLEGIQPEWLIYSEGFKPPKLYLPLKRAFDTTCALLSLVMSAPLLALIAVAIKLDSKGGVLFRQERVGWHGQTFVLFKFRTMHENAEEATGPVWAGENDTRVTRVGRFLRKFRFDELPQLLNVLHGEMSLVGPRPERPHFVRLLCERIPYYGLRHSVKPGVTGWAQVLYSYGASVKDAYEKLQYDLYYAKHMSLGFDLLILLNTIKVVLFGRGR
ncbi:MAG: TIGR03013 family PEP-CTERM/XrtA system glycosyltransferase [Acidobacteria bacterium]|nr:TIGR03013 family PEP-CTERM/XrtA system glycosyltransferase [Acidobacteriota bacterium]